jgi:signal transduction histidine kinase
VINSLISRLGLTVLTIHVVLLPALYVQLDRIVTHSQEEMFITEIRTYARLLADDLELPGSLDSMERVRSRMENILLSGEGVFGRLERADGSALLEVTSPGFDGRVHHEDFSFGEGNDDVYYVSIPVLNRDQELKLWIGFDEFPVVQQINRARAGILVSLGIYFLLVMLLSALVGFQLTRPLVALKRAASRVAGGDTELKLSTSSGIREFQVLAASLERMRSELVSVGRQLQSEMIEREKAVRQGQVLQRQLEARHRLETVGTLAGGIAHEFNNVLVPIQLYTEMAIDDLAPDSPVRADLARVAEAASRAKRIVSDVLVLSRQPDSCEAQSFDLAPVVSQVVDLYREIAPDGIQVLAEFRPGSTQVLGNAAMLNQVVTNLCSNAIQAIGNDAGTIAVCVRPATEGEAEALGRPHQPFVVLSVSDTGHGMDEATAQRIFEPFFTTRDVGTGTGLGLSVVHGMVESMGGVVTVKSAPAAGAVFSVFLRSAEESGAAVE